MFFLTGNLFAKILISLNMDQIYRQSNKSQQAKLLIHEVFNENQLESSEANDNSSRQFFRAQGGQKAGLGAKIHQH